VTHTALSSRSTPVAVRYALRHPERVAKLILFEGVVCDAKDPRAPAAAAEPIIDWRPGPRAGRSKAAAG